MRRSLLVYVLLMALPAVAQDGDEMVGEVVFESGVPLEGVTVYGLDKRGDVVAVAKSGAKGEVRLATHGRRLVLGAGTPRFELVRVETPTPAEFRAIMRVVPQGVQVLDPAVKDIGEVRVTAEGELAIGAARVAVVDETGSGLSGVRVSAYEEGTRVLAATSETDPRGHALLVLAPGRYRLHAVAAGLKPARYEAGRQRPTIVMAIDAQVESIKITEGPHVISFRLDDSVDPEYYPPPQAKAWLKQQYCLDVDKMFRRASVNRRLPGPPPVRMRGPRSPFGDDDRMQGSPRDVPISYAAEQLHLERYWWLKKLYTSPPGVCHHHRSIVRPLLPW
jgi:hypothetical protein